MVLSGLVMAWRFASWPTRRSPLFVNATTDGVIRPPSAFGMIVGSPPSITAIAEFVVPRSIPITRGMCLLPLLGDGHHGGADDPVVKPIRLLVFFDDGPLWLVALDVRDRLVLVRVEGLAERVDRLQALGLEDLTQLALDEPHALDPGRRLELVGDGGERAVVGIEHVEQLRDEVGLRELRELHTLRIAALAVVREVGRHALQVARELGDLVGVARRGLLADRLLGLDLRMAVRAARPCALLEQLFGLSRFFVHQSPSMTRTRSLMSDPTYRTAPMERA